MRTEDVVWRWRLRPHQFTYVSQSFYAALAASLADPFRRQLWALCPHSHHSRRSVLRRSALSGSALSSASLLVKEFQRFCHRRRLCHRGMSISRIPHSAVPISSLLAHRVTSTLCEPETRRAKQATTHHKGAPDHWAGRCSAG